MVQNALSRRVLCFQTALLDKLGRFQGISTDVSKYIPKIITKPNYKYIFRDEAEHNGEFKQIIPYVILLHQDRIFVYRRGKRGSEERLRELYSIGIGGHIEDEDTLLWSSDDVGYEDAMWREVAEEVRINDEYEENCVGLINDDSTSVGKVHFGVIHVVRLTSPSVEKNESSITDAGFIPIERAKQSSRLYETWSKLCLENIELLLR